MGGSGRECGGVVGERDGGDEEGVRWVEGDDGERVGRKEDQVGSPGTVVVPFGHSGGMVEYCDWLIRI